MFIKWGVEAFPPLTFAALRFAFASLPFLLIYRSPGVAWKWIIGIGLFLGVGQFGLLFTGMKLGMPPGLTSAVVQTHAFFTVLFAIVFLKERPRWQNIAGLALAFVGVAVIAGNLGAVPLLPFLCVIGGAACWGVSNILTRQAGADDALRLIVWASLGAADPADAALLGDRGRRRDHAELPAHHLAGCRVGGGGFLRRDQPRLRPLELPAAQASRGGWSRPMRCSCLCSASAPAWSSWARRSAR